ncbi:hypothetical protein HDA35_002301 [Micromonospora purpureochromogenes]|uniref:Uncharacterized protein n=1 Tax=Micromonospora purpureochromogenes TaxID=47872 RepID=A0ABX2RJZ1_9ACTN|nr:hypothetical protein [Micromonospora purpureochromogenes]
MERWWPRKCHTDCGEMYGGRKRAGPVRSSVLRTGPAVCPVGRNRTDQFVAGVTWTVAYELSFAAFRMVIETP